ncbi:MAG TPA: hypothetical protein VMT60_01865, partial [Candidatus Bathyarchaeia archaeon]|nr:hypothetical protein [Candidatus Bathyarchaeia archaeon]
MNESPHARLRAIRRIVMALVAIAFLYAIVETTNWLYSKTSDVYALRPDNILSGLSEAPNQYRILVPLLNRLLRSGGHLGRDESDRLVILASIILCYAAAGALFYKSSRSL